MTLQHLREAGLTVSILAVQERVNGASALQLAQSGFNFWELKEAGCSLMSTALRSGEQQEDAVAALAVLLTGRNCDEETFRAMLAADLLGGLRGILHNRRNNSSQDLSSVRRVRHKAAEMIPLLIAKGISCPALLVHSGVMTPLLQVLDASSTQLGSDPVTSSASHLHACLCFTYL